jgi:hypothetical protein
MWFLYFHTAQLHTDLVDLVSRAFHFQLLFFASVSTEKKVKGMLLLILLIVA